MGCPFPSRGCAGTRSNLTLGLSISLPIGLPLASPLYSPSRCLRRLPAFAVHGIEGTKGRLSSGLLGPGGAGGVPPAPRSLPEVQGFLAEVQPRSPLASPRGLSGHRAASGGRGAARRGGSSAGQSPQPWLSPNKVCRTINSPEGSFPALQPPPGSPALPARHFVRSSALP